MAERDFEGVGDLCRDVEVAEIWQEELCGVHGGTDFGGFFAFCVEADLWVEAR